MRARKRQTGGKSALLEHTVDALHMLGFQIYRSRSEFDKAQVVPQRYVIRNYPHLSLYGTRGSKEALISAPATNGFVVDDGANARIVVEAKWQEAAGSVDEKFPYVWEAFLASDVPNWIVVVDGPYWKTARGKAAVAWFKDRADDETPPGRSFHLTDRMGFNRLARDWWGAA